MPRPYRLIPEPVTKPFLTRQTEKFGMIVLQKLSYYLERMVYSLYPMEDRE